MIISSGGACVFDKKPAEAASTFTPLSSVVYTPESGGGQGERGGELKRRRFTHVGFSYVRRRVCVCVGGGGGFAHQMESMQ